MLIRYFVLEIYRVYSCVFSILVCNRYLVRDLRMNERINEGVFGYIVIFIVSEVVSCWMFFSGFLRYSGKVFLEVEIG